jgi:hypothetical protein
MSTPAALLAKQTTQVPRPATAASFAAVSKAVAAVPINGQRAAKLPQPKPAAKVVQPVAVAAAVDDEAERIDAVDGEEFEAIGSAETSEAADEADSEHDEEAGFAANGEEENREQETQYDGDATQTIDPEAPQVGWPRAHTIRSRARTG